jgi:hypothetical protein
VSVFLGLQPPRALRPRLRSIRLRPLVLDAFAPRVHPEHPHMQLGVARVVAAHLPPRQTQRLGAHGRRAHSAVDVRERWRVQQRYHRPAAM